MSIVFFDLETSGLPEQLNESAEVLERIAGMLNADTLSAYPSEAFADVVRIYFRDRRLPQVIQIAAVVVDDNWRQLEEFEVKLKFDLDLADPESLAMNSFDAAIWSAEAVPQREGIGRFRSLLGRHKTLRLISKAGRPYLATQLAGHNITSFDIPMLTAANAALAREGQRPAYMHHSWQGLDTLGIASWMRIFTPGFNPKNLKLRTLAEYFVVPHPNAHDALGDVRANVQVARSMVERTGLVRPWRGRHGLDLPGDGIDGAAETVANDRLLRELHQ